MSEWRLVRIEEIAEKIAMGPFGSNIKVSTFVDEGVPIISGQHLHGFRLDESAGFNFISPAHADRLGNSNVRQLDIILTHAGTIGQVAIIPENATFDRYVISQRQFFLRPNTKMVDPLFLTYWFHGPVGRHRLLMHASQVGVPSISRPATNLKNIQIELPPLPEQRAIVGVLSALDDKIELNRRMNATLEAMARAIFRDWFVDFGPTRAKIEGREPYLAPDLWPLFPDRLDNEGKPEGWEMGTLGDVAESPRRGVKPSEIPEDTPYIGLEHMPRRSIALSEWEGAGKVTSNKSAFRKGEFLFGKLRPYFHKVGVAPVDGICSTDIVVVRPKRKEWLAYTLACISSDDFVEFTNAASTGTKMPRTSWNAMSTYETCLGTEEVAAAFNHLVAPMIESIIANIHESRTLAQTRDLLLPRLMSGEIRVAEAEKIVEEAL
jgi:type I restriction enzyme S subunit